MAILIEQEKQKSNWFAIVFVATFILIIGVAIYYLFFVNPSLIENITPSARLKMLQDVEQIQSSVKPMDIVNSDAFKSLKVQVQPIIPEPAGNPNPFRISF